MLNVEVSWNPPKSSNTGGGILMDSGWLGLIVFFNHLVPLHTADPIPSGWYPTVPHTGGWDEVIKIPSNNKQTINKKPHHKAFLVTFILVLWEQMFQMSCTFKNENSRLYSWENKHSHYSFFFFKDVYFCTNVKCIVHLSCYIITVNCLYSCFYLCFRALSIH